MGIRQVRKLNNSEEEITTESELLEFCSIQINKMKKHIKLDNVEGFPSFFEVNQALMGHHNVYLSLLTVYYSAKHEYTAAKRQYDNWYAEKYTLIMRAENPRSISAQKFISTKEIEFLLRMAHATEISEKLDNLNLLDEKLSFMRRMLDGWKGHQFVLTQLSKNIMGEAQSKEY